MHSRALISRVTRSISYNEKELRQGPLEMQLVKSNEMIKTKTIQRTTRTGALQQCKIPLTRHSDSRAGRMRDRTREQLALVLTRRNKEQ
jgi:hypothetical protein